MFCEQKFHLLSNENTSFNHISIVFPTYVVLFRFRFRIAYRECVVISIHTHVYESEMPAVALNWCGGF